MTAWRQAPLAGHLVRLEPLREEHFEELFAVACDPLIWEQHPEPTRWQRPVFERFFRGGIESGGAYLIRDAKSGEAIGSSRFALSRHEPEAIEIGWTFLARRCWGHTYNRELKRLMGEHAFRHVPVIYFHIGRGNARSRAAVAKIGASLHAEEGESVIYRLRRGKQSWGA